METDIYNIKGEKTGRTISLDDSVFCTKPNDHAIYLDVKHYMANQRQGTHKTKARADVSRSTRKLFKQKHTGRARAGSNKSPVLKGGGTVFGPVPRTYDMKINRKVKQVARRSALSYKVINNNLMVIEDFDFESPKTRDFVTMLKNLKLVSQKIPAAVGDEGKTEKTVTMKSLFVMPAVTKSVHLSSRNIFSSKVVNAMDLNTYTIMNAGKIVITEKSIPVLQGILSVS